MPLIRDEDPNNYVQIILVIKSKIEIYFLSHDKIKTIYSSIDELVKLNETFISTDNKFWELITSCADYTLCKGMLNNFIPTNISHIVIVRVKQ